MNLVRLSFTGLLVALVAAAGCADDDCTSNADCSPGQVCRLGICSLDPNAGQDVLGDASGDGTGGACRAAQAGDLVLTEILADPGGADVNGDGDTDSRKNEFVELVNFASEPVGLANVSISTGKSPLSIGATCLQPNEARVVFGSEVSLSLTNSGGTVTLLVDGAPVQAHTYGSEADKDESITLTTQDDPLTAWVRHSELSEQPFSPGTCPNGNAFPNCEGEPTPTDADAVGGDVPGDGPGPDIPPTCEGAAPVVGDLLINEILADPGSALDANQDGVADSADDEFVEILNVSEAVIDVSGVTIAEEKGTTFTFPVGTCLQPGQGAVVFAKYEGGGNFGGARAFGLGKGFSLNNSDETVTLATAAGDALDTVAYGSGADDESWTRAVDGDASAEWVRHSQAALSGGAAMSPGTCQNGGSFPDCEGAPPVETPPDQGADVPTNDGGPTDEGSTDEGGPDVPVGDTPLDVGPGCGPAPGVGELVINEVLADPNPDDVNGDGTYESGGDEFVEIVNLSGMALDVGGVTVATGPTADNVSVVHTFPAGTCLEAATGVVIFGGGAPTITSAGAVVVVSDKSLSLNNGGDTVVLATAAGESLDAYTYGGLTTQSWARNPDGSGAFGEHPGDPAYSPGQCVDKQPFAMCLP